MLRAAEMLRAAIARTARGVQLFCDDIIVTHTQEIKGASEESPPRDEEMLHFHSGLKPGFEPGLLYKHEIPMYGHEARQAETLTLRADVVTPPVPCVCRTRGGRHSW